MAQSTSIEWTDASSNLLKYRDQDGKIVWACAKTSPGCAHCYAETLAHRYGKGGPFTMAEVKKVTPFFDDKEAGRLLRSKKLAGKRVFIDDMTDLFGEWVPDEIIDKHFALFALRPDVVFQVLTKRADRMAAYVQKRGYKAYNNARLETEQWPARNVWLGFSAEDQQRFNDRAHCAAQIIRDGWTVFVSAEPLLGPIVMHGRENNVIVNHWLKNGDHPGISWVIIGGESGAGARPMNVQWARDLVGQCKAAGVACFVKQFGSRPFSATDRISYRGNTEKMPDGFSRYLNDRKGGNPEEWPEDLRVRQFPEVKA